MNLRPYQQSAHDAVIQAFENGCKSALIVMATGTGKTVLFSHIIKTWGGKTFGRALVLAHREELIFQARDKVSKICGFPVDIEMAEYRADHGLLGKSPVVVSTIQTQNAGQNQKRMELFDPNEFNLIIIDESHHATADSYQDVVKYYCQNEKAHVLGVTATPDRADKKAMGKVFDEVAFKYDVCDAIEDGWLCPINQHAVTVKGLDFANIRTTAGDLNSKDLAEVMEAEENLHRIATPTLEITDGKKALIFAASLEHADRLCEIFNRHKSGCAEFVHGKTPKEDRRELFKRFADHDFSYLVNVGVLCEGFDDPGVVYVVMARPTKSRSLYAQMSGRATRPAEEIAHALNDYETPEERRMLIAGSIKPTCHIIDFVGNSGRHKLVTTADILGGKYDDDTRKIAKDIAEEATREGKSVDMIQALKEAAQDLHRQAEEKAKREAAQRANLVAKADYVIEHVDAFNVFDIRPDMQMSFDNEMPATQGQMEYLQNCGIKLTDKVSKAHATQLINEIKHRHAARKCSYKQAKILKENGYDPNMSQGEASKVLDRIFSSGTRAATAKQAQILSRYGYSIAGMTFQQASQTIDMIAKNGWKRPAAQAVAI